MNKSLTALFLTVGVLWTAVCSAQDDVVFQKSTNTPTRGLVSAVAPDKITIQTRGGARTIETNDVLKVTFDAEPSELSTARTRALAGEYANAIEELNKIDATTITNDVIRKDMDYYAAYCAAKLALTEGTDKDAAIEQMKGFMKENAATTFHYYEGVELLGDLSFAKSDYTSAATFYGLLSKASWPEYQMRATVLQARAMSAEGNYAGALPGFERVLSSSTSTEEAVEQKMHAMVGKAVCLAATGKHEEGITIIEDLIAKNDPNDATLFGRAYNALGVCYLKSGKTKEALLAFLHTDVLFYRDSEAHAEALYYLSDLWGKVGRSDRSDRTRGLLRSQYAGTRWAGMQ